MSCVPCVQRAGRHGPGLPVQSATRACYVSVVSACAMWVSLAPVCAACSCTVIPCAHWRMQHFRRLLPPPKHLARTAKLRPRDCRHRRVSSHTHIHKPQTLVLAHRSISRAHRAHPIRKLMPCSMIHRAGCSRSSPPPPAPWRHSRPLQSVARQMGGSQQGTATSKALRRRHRAKKKRSERRPLIAPPGSPRAPSGCGCGTCGPAHLVEHWQQLSGRPVAGAPRRSKDRSRVAPIM